MKVVIVGGGIIGAALARHLSAADADVTVIAVGAGATAGSFGWINAGFYPEEYGSRLRAEGLAAWRRLDVPLTWSGTLYWKKAGDAFDAQYQALARLGHDVEVIDALTFGALEPHVSLPDRALRFATEGVANPIAMAHTLLNGVRRISGVQVLGISAKAGQVTGVDTAHGHLPADRVIVAARHGSPAVLRSVGVALPMLDRPGVMMRTASVPPRLAHNLVTPGGEVRQDHAGHLWTLTAAQHQSDSSKRAKERPDLLAERALMRVQALLPDTELRWEQLMQANRPVPQDGRPVIGSAGPEGLFVAVMDFGVTLAAIAAELLGPQVLDCPLSEAQANLAAPYGIKRFQSAMS